MEEDTDESKISAVGRKRNLEETQDQDQSSLHDFSPRYDEQRATKRVREDEQPLEDEGRGNGAMTITSSLSTLSSESHVQPALTTPRLGGAWNKGVQSGLRTSFGSRAPSKSKSLYPQLQNADSHAPSNSNPDSTSISEAYSFPAMDYGGEEDAAMVEVVEQLEEQPSPNVNHDAADIALIGKNPLLENPALPYVEKDEKCTVLAGSMDLLKKQTLPIAKQGKIDEVSALAEPSALEMEILVSSGEDEGEIISSRGTEDEAGMLQVQMPITARNAVVGDDGDDAHSWLLQTSTSRHGAEGSSAGNVRSTYLHPGKSFGRPSSLSTPESHRSVGVEARSPAQETSDISTVLTLASMQRSLDDKLVAKSYRSDLSASPRLECIQSRKASDKTAAMVSSGDADDTEIDIDAVSQTGIMTTSMGLPSAVPHPGLSKSEKAAAKETKKQMKKLVKIKEFERRTLAAEAVFSHDALPLPLQHCGIADEIGSGLTYFPKKVPMERQFYRKSKTTWRLSEILNNGRPIRVENFKFNDFAPAFLKQNVDISHLPSKKVLASAYSAYMNLYYTHCLHLGNWTKLVARSASKKNAMSLKEMKRIVSADTHPMTNAHAPSDNGNVTGEEVQHLDSEDSSRSQSRSDGPMCPNTTHDPSVIEFVEMCTDPEDIDLMGHDLERDLQKKYFPSTIGRPNTYHCLACGNDSHKTIQCPDLTCVVCGGNHAHSTCPQNQRCKKCRNRGHQTLHCPEKLARSQAEAVECELCGYQDHLEDECHHIWRTFNPRPKDIRKVREIPLYCYTCGATGHYGPECGVRRGGRILSGGQTFSKANLLKYVDAGSDDRAISAGVDYSITSRPQKQISIKGMASDPIDLNISDGDDVAFITEKVRKPKGNSKIKVAALRKGQLLQNDSYSRRPNSPRQSRPHSGTKFVGRAASPRAIGSARYGRERTFSPPPRFGDVHYGYAEADDRFRPQAAQRGEDFYRPQPQHAHNYYNSNPQGTLPVRPLLVPPGIGTRGGGNAGRGGKGGGNNSDRGRRPGRKPKPGDAN